MVAASPRHSRAERFAGLAFALLVHAAVLWALLQIEGVRRVIVETAPIMVSLIAPPKAEPAPKVQRRQGPPEQRPAPREPVATPPLQASTAQEQPAPSAPAPVPVEAPRAAVPAPAAPVVPPSFDAAYLRNPHPSYPLLSRRYREQGRVVLRVYVSAAGAAGKVEVETSSGWPRLDEAAQDAVREWHFVPARQGERSVAAWVNVPLRFSLEN